MCLKISQISQETTCVRISFYWSCRLCRLSNFIKKRLQHRCFPEHLFCRTTANGCLWFLQVFNLDMLRDKRRNSTEFFRWIKPPSPIEKRGLLKGWKYLLKIVLEFFKNCQIYKFEAKSLKCCKKKFSLVKFEVFSLQLYY